MIKFSLLTKEENFFKNIGFKSCDMKDLPEKVYKDCIFCSSHPICEDKSTDTDLCLIINLTVKL